MEGSHPIRFLIILSTAESGEILDDNVGLGRIAPAYYLFKDAGAEVVIATSGGGYPLLPDSRGPREDHVRRFLDDRAARDDLAETLSVQQIVVDDFDAALCVGFTGRLWENAEDGVSFVLESLLDDGRLVAILPGSGVVLNPKAAGTGLLIIGDAADAPLMAAHALLKIVNERRNNAAFS